MSLWIFGDTPFAVRLPSILAFIGTTLILFWFTWRRSGGGFALLTAGLLWSTGFLAFATQARPYALELLFGSLAFVAWTWAVSRQRWSLAHSLLCGALANLILTHCFARIPANLALHGRCPAKWRPYAREL
jgi:4-amino-4-deoxy-L-arabinose transferase-like glycosyltransferase